MIWYLWEIDTWLAGLAVIGFILYIIVSLIGAAVDKVEEWYYNLKKYIKRKLKERKNA